MTLTRWGVELEAPVVTLGGRELLQLRFDVLADEAEPLRYSISHCDRHWQRDDLEPHEFMQGFESGRRWSSRSPRGAPMCTTA